MKYLNNRLPFPFYIFNSCFLSFVLTLIASSYVIYSDVSDWNFLNYCYFFGVSFSLYLCLSLLIIVIFTGILNFFRFIKAALSLVFILDALIIILFLADTFVFKQFRLHLNLAMLEMTLLGGGQIVSFSVSMITEIIIYIVTCCAVALICLYLSFKFKKFRKTSYLCLFFGVLLFLLTNVIHGFSFALHKQSFVEVSELLPLNKPITFNKLLVKSGFMKKEDVYSGKIDIGRSGKGLRYPLHPLKCDRPTQDYNIIFLFVDSLRADMLTEKYMPFTYNFSKKAINFEDHYSGGINTRHAIFTLFTGLPGSYWFKALSTKTPSILVQALEQKNYEITAFTGAGLTMPEFNQTIFSGVKNLRLESKGKNSIERDLDAIKDFETWIDNRKTSSPFFSFIFLDNVHANQFPETPEHTFFTPYWKEINHLELNNSFDREPFFNRYKNSVRFADSNIQKIMDFLKSKKLLEKTIVVIGSDHGEEFNDNKMNFWGHNGNFTQYQAKVPLVIYWPGMKPQTISYRTSMLDIVATLLPDALGCSNKIEDYSAGKSLWEDGKRSFVFVSNYSNDAFVEPQRIVIINKAGSLEFRDNKNKKKSERTAPGYWKEAIEQMTRFLR